MAKTKRRGNGRSSGKPTPPRKPKPRSDFVREALGIDGKLLGYTHDGGARI